MKSHSKKVILRTEATRQHALSVVSALPIDENSPFVVEIKPYVKKRSLDQNSLLHMWIGEIASQTGNEPETVKEYLREKYIQPVFTEWKCPETGLYRPKAVPRSTTTLNVSEMSEFLNRIDAWASGYGLTLSQPIDLMYSIR